MGEVRSNLDEGVLELVIDRPERRNALDFTMYEQLVAALDRASRDAEVRAVLIRGEGACFTSGNDLADFRERPPTGTDTPVFRLLQRLVDFEKPLVAAVHGHAVGIGTTFLLHCDLVYAAPSARFLLPFVNLGLVPEAGSSYLLPRVLGHRRAAELLLLGEPFGPDQAVELGLANRVVAEEKVVAVAREAASTLAARAPEAVRRTKALMRGWCRETLRQVMHDEGVAFIERLASPEAAEAFQAFFEKRKPDFSRFHGEG